MTAPDPALLAALHGLAAEALAARPGLVVVGICGAQGSGKSTLGAALARRLEGEGTRTAVLSLDDLYLSRAARAQLARDIHPLLATRGVPGTHDVALGLAVIERLALGEACALPRFDKGMDDRAPQDDWPMAPAGTRLLVLEGWCLGARPQPAHALAHPVNSLEADEDPQGQWRSYVNQALAGPYQALFAKVDRLVLLAAPDWAVVEGWRAEQEQALHRRAAPQAMDAAALHRFLQHYERLTRWILAEMPARADLVARLDEGRRVVELSARGTSPATLLTPSPRT